MKDRDVARKVKDKHTKTKSKPELWWGACPTCGWYTDEVSNYCEFCGQKLDWEE